MNQMKRLILFGVLLAVLSVCYFCYGYEETLHRGFAGKSDWDMVVDITNVTSSTQTFPGNIVWWGIYPKDGSCSYKPPVGDTWGTLDSGIAFFHPGYNILVSSPGTIILSDLSTSATYRMYINGVIEQ